MKNHEEICFFTILLTLLIILILNYELSIKNFIINTFCLLSNSEIYTYNSDNVNITIYNKTGNLTLKLNTKHIQYNPHQKITQFVQPEIIIFDEKNIPSWKISCNQAILNNKKILYLNGYVYINKLKNNVNMQSIITHQALINLLKQDIFSNTKTIIHGSYFYSIGFKMHTNLKIQTITLFNKTYTYYDI